MMIKVYLILAKQADPINKKKVLHIIDSTHQVTPTKIQGPSLCPI